MLHSYLWAEIATIAQDTSTIFFVKEEFEGESTVADWCHATLRFQFPFSMAPINHGNIVADRLPSLSPSPGTYRPQYLSATVPIGHGTCHFAFPISIFQFACY